MKKTILLFWLTGAGLQAPAQQVVNHLTSAENSETHVTWFNLPPSALDFIHYIVVVKPTARQLEKNPHPVGVWLGSIRGQNRWCVYNENLVTMQPGIPFTAYVLPLGPDAFTVTVTGGKLVLNHPKLNNNASALFYSTHLYNTTRQTTGIYNNSHLENIYNYKTNRWEVRNADKTALPENMMVNIYIPGPDAGDPRNQLNNVGREEIRDIAEQRTTTYTDETLNKLLQTNNKPATLSHLASLPAEKRLLIHQQSTRIINRYYLENPGEYQYDQDNDRSASRAAGGDDCDDLNPLVNGGLTESCGTDSILLLGNLKVVWMSSIADEDCNYVTVAPVPNQLRGYLSDPVEGDRDGDGIISCTCTNYFSGESPDTLRMERDPLIRKWWSVVFEAVNRDVFKADYVTRGTDCDDNNPAIGKSGQQCIGPNKVAVCSRGKWEIRDCRKCVTQPNGTGLVVEWVP